MRSLGLLLLIVMAVSTLCGLGTWQLYRLDWKTDLVNDRNLGLSEPRLLITEEYKSNLDNIDWKRVEASGDWLDPTLILGNRARAGVRGLEYVKALRISEGHAVLVNLGWSREVHKDLVLADIDELFVGSESVKGLAIDRSQITASKTKDGLWTKFSPLSMTTEFPSTQLLNWTITEGSLDGDFTSRSKLLKNGFTPYINTTPHLEYALTWFGIAGVLLIVVFVRLRNSNKKPKVE